MAFPHLQVLDPAETHHFELPTKKINEGKDVTQFRVSKAYGDLLTFILQLNVAMFPRQTSDAKYPLTWELGSEAVPKTEATRILAEMLSKMTTFIEEAPPDPGPRRFGNASFRRWYELATERSSDLLRPVFDGIAAFADSAATDELTAYLLGSFGSAQRLDYGSGHELSFLAFLAGLWKLDFFGKSDDGSTERAIVTAVIEPYLVLIRRLILTYNLEPAGSHGVWGLDDHSFAPYIFGSAQLAIPIKDAANVPQEGSLPGAPDPGDVAKAALVEKYRGSNMYFSAVGFIYDVKKGPFWEHSPMLFDISGVQAGWAKINKGMIKMYIAEVLSKFPVVQHFPFGYLFQWERDTNAVAPAETTHTTSQPARAKPGPLSDAAPSAVGGTTAPWASKGPMAGTSALSPAAAPWARSGVTNPSDPRAMSIKAPDADLRTTRAPWANQANAAPNGSGGQDLGPTKAPWAR